MQSTRRAFFRHVSCATGAMLLARHAKSAPADDPASPRHPVLNPWRLEPVDLRRFIRLGVEHIYTGAVNPKRGYLPFVRFNLTDPPTWARHEHWGSPHMPGRFLDALSLCAAVPETTPPNEPVIQGLRTLIHDCLDNPWHLPFDTLPDPDGRTTCNMHHCREVLLALVALNQWRGCAKSLELARQLIRAMDKASKDTGVYPSRMLGTEGWLDPEPGWVNYTTGRAIGALTAYFRATNDGLALELAKRFADANIAQTFTPDGNLTQAAGYHLHSTEGTMAALLDLGTLTGDKTCFAFGKKLYDTGLPPYRTSYGWAKETTGDSPGRGEANNTGDFIAAALTLAQNGHSQYFDDAERFIRNGLLAAQVVNTDWIEQSGEADTEDYAYSNIRARARGAFAFTTPNGYHSYNTDLMGGALRSLCEAYQAAVTEKEGAVSINMPFTGDYPALSIRSQLPKTGIVEITAHNPISLDIRQPEFVAREAIHLQLNGKDQKPAWGGGCLRVGAVAPGATITVTFDLPQRQTQESARGRGAADITWRGNTIVAMSPNQGKIALY